MKTFLLLLSFLSFVCLAHPPQGQDLAKCEHQYANYLANAGIMVSTNSHKILFDAFFTNGFGQYALVPTETQQLLLNAQPPWDNISALFISHVHGDHFSPAPTLTYLRANPGVEVYASSQVIEKLSGSIDSKRLNSIEFDTDNSVVATTLGTLKIDAVQLPHSGGERHAEIINLAFRVQFDNDLTVLHLGDADPNDQNFSIYQSHWDKKSLEVAFPPYWFLGTPEGDQILSDRLKAEQVIGVHVPIAAADDPETWKARHQGDLFTTPGEIRAIGTSKCEHTDQ